MSDINLKQDILRITDANDKLVSLPKAVKVNRAKFAATPSFDDAVGQYAYKAARTLLERLGQIKTTKTFGERDAYNEIADDLDNVMRNWYYAIDQANDVHKSEYIAAFSAVINKNAENATPKSEVQRYIGCSIAVLEFFGKSKNKEEDVRPVIEALERANDNVDKVYAVATEEGNAFAKEIIKAIREIRNDVRWDQYVSSNETNKVLTASYKWANMCDLSAKKAKKEDYAALPDKDELDYFVQYTKDCKPKLDRFFRVIDERKNENQTAQDSILRQKQENKAKARALVNKLKNGEIGENDYYAQVNALKENLSYIETQQSVLDTCTTMVLNLAEATGSIRSRLDTYTSLMDYNFLCETFGNLELDTMIRAITISRRQDLHEQIDAFGKAYDFISELDKLVDDRMRQLTIINEEARVINEQRAKKQRKVVKPAVGIGKISEEQKKEADEFMRDLLGDEPEEAKTETADPAGSPISVINEIISEFGESETNLPERNKNDGDNL